MGQLFSFLLLTVVVFVIACSDDDNPAAADNNATSMKGEYTGIAKTTIQYYDYDPYAGQDYFIEEKSYEYPIFLYIKSPVKVGSVVEENPINLSIYPDRDSGDEEEGYIDISSAIVLNDEDVGQVLLQYWTLKLENNKVTGTLTDTHTAEAAAANLLWAWDEITSGLTMTWPFPIARNTSMSGTLSDNSISLEIVGQSTNTYRQFQSTITAAK